MKDSAEVRDALSYEQIQAFVRTSGSCSFLKAGHTLNLDLRHKHERAYAAKCLLRVHYPQSDIDTLLFNRFVRPGDRVLDAGANIGFTALECLDAGAAHVVALEPVPTLFARLRQLESEQVTALQVALGKNSESAEMVLSTAHNQGSTLKQEMLDLHPSVFGDHLDRVRVEVTTLDALTATFGAFDIWKLDIEGAEVDALEGALTTLAKYPPRVIIAELYGDLFGAFAARLAATHPHAYRAYITRGSYELCLEPPNAPNGEIFCQTSPTYVFRSQPLSPAD